jgi:hypothetical protein
VLSDQHNRTLAWAQDERALGRLKIVYNRVIHQPLIWISKRRVLVLAVLAVAALAVSALLGIPPAWRLGPAYFEAIGTWVGALGGMAAILVAGAALYHQRTTDLRAEQAREAEDEAERADELARAVKFSDVRLSQDNHGVWCADIEVALLGDFPYSLRSAAVRGILSDPQEATNLDPSVVRPGQVAKAVLRFPGVVEDIVRLESDAVTLQFFCWGKGWQMRPGGYVRRDRRIERNLRR